MPLPRENAYNFFVRTPKATKLKTNKLPIDAYKYCDFRKSSANELPLRGKFIAKIRNFDSFWICLYSHISAPINVKFGKGERTCGPHAKISRLLGQRVTPYGAKKPIFGH